MLVISRQLGETVYIGPDISVRVEDIYMGRVRLAISSPPDVRILREEIAKQDAEFWSKVVGTGGGVVAGINKAEAARDGVDAAWRWWLERNPQLAADVIREAVADAVFDWLEQTDGEVLKEGGKEGGR